MTGLEVAEAGAERHLASGPEVGAGFAGFGIDAFEVGAAFFGRHDVWAPLFWILAALTMTVGNLVALRQTNVVRMLA